MCISRTMMVLGQAAGTAAALFGPKVHALDPDILRTRLQKDGVALDLETGYLDAMSDLTPIVKSRG